MPKHLVIIISFTESTAKIDEKWVATIFGVDLNMFTRLSVLPVMRTFSLWLFNEMGWDAGAEIRWVLKEENIDSYHGKEKYDGMTHR